MSLKEKSHIRVNEDAVLIGIPDGFGLLKPGEVFVRVQRETSSEFKEQILEQEKLEASDPLNAKATDKLYSKIDIGNACETRQKELQKKAKAENERDNLKRRNKGLIELECENVDVPKVIVTKNPCSHPGDIRLLTPISLASLKERMQELFPGKPSGQKSEEEALEELRGVLARQSEVLAQKFFVSGPQQDFTLEEC